MTGDHHSKSEDELLADAIPIDPADLEEDPEVIDEIEEIEEAPKFSDADDLTPIELDAPGEEGAEASVSGRTIQTFASTKRHEENWTRTPNSPGTGAIHVKTFVTKLRLDAIEHMDQQINEWLDAHPQYEVKFVTTSIGKLIGKNTEEALFMNVWV